MCPLDPGTRHILPAELLGRATTYGVTRSYAWHGRSQPPAPWRRGPGSASAGPGRTPVRAARGPCGRRGSSTRGRLGFFRALGLLRLVGLQLLDGPARRHYLAGQAGIIRAVLVRPENMVVASWAAWAAGRTPGQTTRTSPTSEIGPHLLELLLLIVGEDLVQPGIDRLLKGRQLHLLLGRRPQ